jgi:hypothetical protein
LTVFDRSSAPDCPTNTPMPPTQGSTLPPTTTMKPLSVNIASELFKMFVCKGFEKTINIPSGYSLAVINSYYGTTPDYTCNTIKYLLLNLESYHLFKFSNFKSSKL